VTGTAADGSNLHLTLVAAMAAAVVAAVAAAVVAAVAAAIEVVIVSTFATASIAVHIAARMSFDRVKKGIWWFRA